jgi:hypothetical protein
MNETTQKILIVLGSVTIITIAITSALVAVRNHEIDATINQQTEVQKTKIVEQEKSQRADTHLQWLPWN